MGYTVHIEDTQTGQQRYIYADSQWQYPHKDSSGDIYWWGDGNYGCDCNRGPFFYDTQDKESGFDCGEGRFVVHGIADEHGQLVYSDHNPWIIEDD